MQTDLATATESGAFALFDPGAVEPMPEGARQSQWEQWLARQEQAGAIFTCRDPDGGAVQIKLIVDEEFDGDGHVRSEVFQGAVLRVPTGRLYFAGVECLFWGGDRRALPPRALRRIDPPAQLPPGDFAVTAFHVDWQVDGERIRSERDAMLREGDERFARRIDHVGVPLGCLTMIVGATIAALMLLAGSAVRLRFVWAAISLAAAVVAGVTLWRLGRSPRLLRWRQAQRELYRRYPHTVIQLRRLPAGQLPATFAPGRYSL